MRLPFTSTRDSNAGKLMPQVCGIDQIRVPIALLVPFAALCSILLAALPAWSQEQKAIQLVGFNYPPFYEQSDDTIDGIAIALAQELFSRMDLAPNTRIYPLKRALQALDQGTADATMILIKTPDRSEYLHFTDPVMTVRGLIWSSAASKGGAVQFEKLESLSQYTTGVTRGYSYGPKFDKLLKTMHVLVADSDYQNFLLLQEGRIDIFPGNEIVAEGLFKAHPDLQGQFIHSDKSFIEWTLRIAFSKLSSYASLIPRINEELAKMRADGTIDSIVHRYTH